MTTAATRPRLYGYFRVRNGMDDTAVLKARQMLAAFAEQGGFELVDIYEDDGPSRRLQVWLDMVETCRSEDAPAVVALSMDSFHPTPELATFMREELAEKIKGTVFVADTTLGEAAMMTETLVSRLDLAPRAEATPWARRHVRDVLRAWRVTDEQIDTTELAVSEMVSNAVRHVAPGTPQAQVTLTLRHDDTQLIAEVADPGNRPPVANVEVSDEAESGRGLLILEAISKEWDYYFLPTGGKVVWCAIRLS